MTMTPDTTFSLADRYQAATGEVLLTGIQALVRGPLDQLRADRRAGLRTAGFVSGYQGSPLGGYDRELQANRALLDELRRSSTGPARQRGARRHGGDGQPAVRDVRLARRYDGVVGVWYGKAPGVDRASDAIRHAQFAGTAPPRRRARPGRRRRRPASRRRCPPAPSRSLAALGLAGPLPRHRAGRPRPRPPRRRAVAGQRAVGRASRSSPRSPTAPASSTSTPDRSPVVPMHGGRRPALVAQADRARSARRTPRPSKATSSGPGWSMARRYVVVNALNRVVVDGPAPGSASSPPATPPSRSSRPSACSASTSDELPRPSGSALLKLGAAATRSTRDAVRRLAAGVETVLVVEDKQPFLETLVPRRALRHADAAAASSASATPKARRSCPSPARSRRRRWSSRCAALLATRSSPERLRPAPARCSRSRSRVLPEAPAHAVLLLRLPAQHRHARCPRARSSAPASAATAWSR